MRERPKKAVALRYRADMPAPAITVSATGKAAELAIELAEASGVPVVEDSALAEAISPFAPGEFVPERYWEALAAVFAFLAKQEGST